VSSHPAVLFERLLIDACSPGDREALIAETDLIARRYVPDNSAEALSQLAALLDSGSIEFDEGQGRDRLKLWAAMLRQRAAAASPDIHPLDRQAEQANRNN
jgi:hypothetical protein